MQPVIDFFQSPLGAILGVIGAVLLIGVAKYVASLTKTKVDDWAIAKVEEILVGRGIVPAEVDDAPRAGDE